MPTTPTTITAEKTAGGSYRLTRWSAKRVSQHVGIVYFIQRQKSAGWATQTAVVGARPSRTLDKTAAAAAFHRWGAAARDAVKAASAPKNPTADLAAINVWAP